MVRAIAVALVTLLTPTAAFAAAPREAVIAEGASLAGVPLNASAPRNDANDRVTSGPLAAWGKVRLGFCFEGTNCQWSVSGGGVVDVILDARTSRVRTMATTARRWRTAKDVGPGSTRSALRRAYGSRIVARTTCGLNGFGGTSRGYVLNTRRQGERRFTFFELTDSRSRVERVWIGRGRAVPGADC